MTDIHLVRARYVYFVNRSRKEMRMPRTLKANDRPSKDQMRIAIEWLRKNDLGDADTLACEKTARLLEAKITEGSLRMAARQIASGEI